MAFNELTGTARLEGDHSGTLSVQGDDPGGSINTHWDRARYAW